MKVCGIIAEYDPFHKGHAWQIEQAKEKSGADYIVCVMSCSFTQRGMPAFLSAHDRAEMALRCGADVVLGMPYAFSVTDAEHFALGGIEILRKTQAVNALSFGVEEAGLPYIHAAAALLEQPTASYTERLKAALDQGVPYPKAQGDALAAELHTSADIFSLPNTSLAICYLRAMLRQQADFSVQPVLRRGSYHSDVLPEDAVQALPSATAVRAAISVGDMPAVRQSLPQPAYDVLVKALSEGRFHAPDALDMLLRWRLCQATDFSHLPDLSEGIENRFPAAAKALIRADMVQQIKTKRYPYARINRMLAHLLTDTDAKQLNPLPEYAYLLGFRKSAQPLVHAISESELPLLTRLSSRNMTYMQQLDARAAELWALGARTAFGHIFRCKPVILP